MKRKFFASIMVLIVLTLIGCGHSSNNNEPSQIVTQILSNPALDGDIVNDPATSASFTVTQGMTPTVQTVFAGIDPSTGSEYRAFLDFPLAGIPGNAAIVSAVLDIVLYSVRLQTSTDLIPIRIDLVSFSQPMIGTDFLRSSQLALATTTIEPPISQADYGHRVLVDVTSLMTEAQRLGLANFQVRILEDNITAVPPGLIEINDTTGPDQATLAPMLEVTYR
jgi:hypothetical protein